MSQATGNRSRRAVGRVLGGASAALLFAAAIVQPEVANADDGGGGGGGFHGSGGGFHGGRFHHRFRAAFGFGGIYPPFWWGYGYPFYPFTTTGITVTIPNLATAHSPTPGRPGTIAPTQLAIIHMWHTATPCGSTVPVLQ